MNEEKLKKFLAKWIQIQDESAEQRRVNYSTLNPDGFEDGASNDDRKATVHYDKLRKNK